MELKTGDVNVVIAPNGGHSPEFYAEAARRAIISVSNDTPEPVRQQTVEYADKIQEIILKTLKRAIASDRLSIYNTLLLAGHKHAAAIVMEK